MEERELNRAIGRRLRVRRRLLNMTLAELGAMSGCSHQLIHKYEAGQVAIPTGRLIRVAAALRIPPSYFLDDVLGLQQADPTELFL